MALIHLNTGRQADREAGTEAGTDRHTYVRTQTPLFNYRDEILLTVKKHFFLLSCAEQTNKPLFLEYNHLYDEIRTYLLNCKFY